MSVITQSSLDLSTLLPITMSDLNSNTDTPDAGVGMLGIMKDAFGVRMFRYVKNVHSAALVLGDVVTRAADVAFTAASLAGYLRVTTSGLTASAHIGKLLLVEGNDTVEGAAPEGEVGVIVANSATVVTLDRRMPLSVATAADIDCRISTPGWHVIQAGATALAQDVQGVVCGVDGISVGNYGWVLCDGFAPRVKVTAAAIAAGAGIVTGASGAVATEGANTTEKVIGYSPGAVAATNAGLFPMVLTLITGRTVAIA